MNMKNDKIMVPEVTSVQLFKLIKYIYPADDVPVERLNGIFGKSKVANSGATGASIGILVRDKSTISLTKEGQKLGRALVSKNLEEQRKILKEVVLKNPVVEFIHSLIKEKRVMKNKEIGQKIAMQFNKNWKHELSFSRYGTNCGDILAAADLGDYVNGIYSIEKIRTENVSEGISSPAIRFNEIIKILKELNAKEKNIENLFKSLGIKNKGKLSSGLSNCINLNLIKKSAELYSITQRGIDLIDPINDEETQKNLFVEVLRRSPYAKVVESIEQNDSIDRKKVGGIIVHRLKKEGGEEYQYTLGKIFTNWLEAANINCVEKSKRIRGKQKKLTEKSKKEEIKILKPKANSTNQLIKDVTPETIFPKDNKKIVFQIGRLIERIEIKNSANQDIIEDVKELINTCEKDVSFKPYINLLNSHFKIYSEIKDFRIIEADLKFLKEKFNN